jgi:hypothetical protein
LKNIINRQLQQVANLSSLEDSDDSSLFTPLDKKEAKLQRQKQKQLQKQLDKQHAKTKMKGPLSENRESNHNINITGGGGGSGVGVGVGVGVDGSSEHSKTTKSSHSSSESDLHSYNDDNEHQFNFTSLPTFTHLNTLTPVELCLTLRNLTLQIDSLPPEHSLRTTLLTLTPKCYTFLPSRPSVETRLSTASSQETTSNLPSSSS